MHASALACPLRIVVGDIRRSQDYTKIVNVVLQPSRVQSVMGAGA